MDNTLPRCSGIKSSGQRCERIVSTHGVLCYSHDPTKAQQRKEIASKGGKISRKSNAPQEILEVRGKLKAVSEAVEAGRLTTAKGSVIAQILGVLLRTFEQERKQQEHEDILQRLEAVERQYSHKGNKAVNDDYPFGGGSWAT